MIIRKPTKIELKPEDDFEEYEQYKQEQQEQLSKFNKNQDNGIGQFGSDFGINIHGSNRLFNQPYSLGGGSGGNGPNDRSFIGESYQSNFQAGLQYDINYRYNHNSSISGSSINNFSSNNQGSFDRTQTGGSNSTEGGANNGGQFSQLFSALIGNPALGIRPTHTSTTTTNNNNNNNNNTNSNNNNNNNPQTSLNNSN